MLRGHNDNPEAALNSISAVKHNLPKSSKSGPFMSGILKGLLGKKVHIKTLNPILFS